MENIDFPPIFERYFKFLVPNLFSKKQTNVILEKQKNVRNISGQKLIKSYGNLQMRIYPQGTKRPPPDTVQIWAHRPHGWYTVSTRWDDRRIGQFQVPSLFKKLKIISHNYR